MNVQENPLDSRQLLLDLMCLPALFPTGAFGENHVLEEKINHAEYAIEDEKEESEEDDDDGPQLMGEAKSGTDDALGMNYYPPDKLDLETRVGMLNADQRRIFVRVKEHLFHEKRQEDGTCQCVIKTLCMLISGVGSTGKSFLIEG